MKRNIVALGLISLLICPSFVKPVMAEPIAVPACKNIPSCVVTGTVVVGGIVYYIIKNTLTGVTRRVPAKQEVDYFLYPIDFKNPQEVIGTHCLESTIVNETNDKATVRRVKTPQLIQDIELFTLESSTEDYFAKTLEKHKEFIDQSKVVQILNLYCVFDESISHTREEKLIVEEKVTIKA